MSSPAAEGAAFALFRAGRLVEAEAAWREIVAREPGNANALHLLGFILSTTGRAEEGMPWLDRSIEAAPRNAAFLDNRAQVLMQAGRDAEALRDLKRATTYEPGSAATWLHLSQAARRVGDREGAHIAIAKALAIEPASGAAAYHDGLLRLEAGDYPGAEASLRALLAREPRNVPALNNLGVVLRETGRANEALVSFQRAAASDPSNAEVLNNLGLALHHDGQGRDAIRLFKRALELRPGFGQALLNWGNVMRDEGDLEGARARFLQALAADESFVPARVNLASVLLENERLHEARGQYEAAQSLQPASADARAGLAQVRLREQRFAEGWADYESRFDTDPPSARARVFGIPRLDAASIGRARRVAVWMEQGVGDQILFSTLIPELTRRGLEVVAEVDPRLLALYRRGLPDVQFVTPPESGSAFVSCDHHVPLGSLPGLFRLDSGSFNAQPHSVLAANDAQVQAWRAQLGAGPLIAISWRSLQKGGRRGLGERKSIPLEAFFQLAENTGARLVDVQYGDLREERAIFDARHPGILVRPEGLDAFNDLEGLAAVLVACGRLVTSSNVTAHLAGALGVPTSLLYLRGWAPFPYWVPGPAGHSLWYPAVRVPESAFTDWGSAFGAVGGPVE